MERKLFPCTRNNTDRQRNQFNHSSCYLLRENAFFLSLAIFRKEVGVMCEEAIPTEVVLLSCHFEIVVVLSRNRREI